MGHAFGFGADLPHKVGGREVRQDQGGDEYRTDNGLGSVQGKVSGGSDKRQQGGNHSLDRKLQQLNRTDPGSAYSEGDQFGPDWNPAVTEQGVAERHIHDLATCIQLAERAS
jgi:hypothetical protein